MPFYPSTVKCSYFGCKNERSNLSGYCTLHGGRNTVTRESDAQYKTAAWKRIRTGQLSKQPLCQCCLLNGKVCAASEVDHVFPWRVFGKHSFQVNQFQSLCKHCHAHKTQREQRGVYMFFGPAKAVEYTDADFPRIFEN